MFLGFIFSGGYRKLDRSQTIIATTKCTWNMFSFIKKSRFLKNEVIFINMGIFAKRQYILKTHIYKKILENVKMLCLSKYEKSFLSTEFKSKI